MEFGCSIELHIGGMPSRWDRAPALFLSPISRGCESNARQSVKKHAEEEDGFSAVRKEVGTVKGTKLFGVVATLLGAVLVGQPSWADDDFVISCEGARSTGGGNFDYQYTLKNNTAVALTLDQVCIGTQDPNLGNYAFQPTAGFVATLIPNTGGPPCSVTATSKAKTVHGVVPPQGGAVGSSMIIYWSGGAIVPAGGTITFAFDNPYDPWDQEWFAHGSSAPSGWTISKLFLPLSGPSGTYTLGWVHAPGVAPIDVPTLTAWGIVTLVLAILLLIAGGIWTRSRRGGAAVG